MLSFASLGAKARGTSQAPAQQEDAAAKTREAQVAHVTRLYQSAVEAMGSGSRDEARVSVGLRDWMAFSRAKHTQDTFEGILASEALADEENAHVGRLRLLCRKSLALLEEERGEVARAMAHCSEALRLDPGDVALAYRLAELAMRRPGDLRTARRALETALRADPHFWPALTLQMEMLFALRDDLGCLDAALRCLEAQPYCQRALELRADILFRNGRVSLASRGLAFAPPSPRPLVELPRRPQPVEKPVEAAEVEIKTFSWSNVANKVSYAVRKCFRAPLRLKWSESGAESAGNGEEENSKSCSQPPGTPSSSAAAASAAAAQLLQCRLSAPARRTPRERGQGRGGRGRERRARRRRPCSGG